MRAFIRHPVNIPIEVSELDSERDQDAHASHLANIQRVPPVADACSLGQGGLCLQTDCKMKPGTLVNIRIPYLHPAFETTAKVVWCRDLAAGKTAELGVEFLNSDDAYRARMVEQVCHIEDYRQQNHRLGRHLSLQDAALEWVSKFAAEFPAL